MAQLIHVTKNSLSLDPNNDPGGRQGRIIASPLPVPVHKAEAPENQRSPAGQSPNHTDLMPTGRAVPTAEPAGPTAKGSQSILCPGFPLPGGNTEAGVPAGTYGIAVQSRQLARVPTLG